MKFSKDSFFLILLLSCILSFCQNDVKPKYYIDETDNYISKEEFKNKIDIAYNLPIEIEKDSMIVNKLLPRRSFGKLNKTQLFLLHRNLKAITSSLIDSSKSILIYFHYERNSNLDYFEKNKISRKFENKDVNFISVVEKGFTPKVKRYSIVEDSFDKIRRNYFNDYFQGANFLIVKPDGNYYRYYGEFMVSHSIDMLEADNWSYDSLSSSQITNYTEVERSDLISINDTFESRFYDLISFYYYNKNKKFNKIVGDFFNVKSEDYGDINISSSFWADTGKQKNILRVMIRKTGKTPLPLSASEISASSKNLGELKLITNKRFPSSGPYETVILGLELPIKNPEESIRFLDKDVVKLIINNEIYEFVAPSFY